MILMGEAVTNLLAAQIDFVAFKHKIRHYARLAIFLAVFCSIFSVKAQTVPLCLGDSQPSLRYQKSIVKMMKYCSKMFTGIGSLYF